MNTIIKQHQRFTTRVNRHTQSSDISLRRQQGLVLIVALLAMVIILLASVALIRSTDTNLLIAGNMAFKRDLINQAERAIPQITDVFTTGTLASATSRVADVAGANYYATIRTTNTSGIPDELFNVADNNANNIVDSNAGVIVHYVIDRMCLSAGAVDSSSCSLAGSTTDLNGGGDDSPKTSGVELPVYRITMKVTGPRNTVAYLQTTYTN
jgi:type IV pilus assembly protein PilX